jgi:hypothetical protein
MTAAFHMPYSAHFFELFIVVVLLSHRSSREQGILLSQILADIRLSERHDARGIEFPSLSRRPRTNSKALQHMLALPSIPSFHTPYLPAAYHSYSAPRHPDARDSPHSTVPRAP